VAPEALGTPAADEAAPDAEDACRPGLTRRADGTCGPASRPPPARKAAAEPDRTAERCRDGDKAAAACAATPAAAPAPAASGTAPAAGTSG
jgi:hypothetical protein